MSRPAAVELVLASGSPHRRMLLQRLDLPFTVHVPGVEEHRLTGESPAAMALRLAEEKARAVAAARAPALIIASDQVAALGEEIMGKPGGFARAREQLLRVSGRRVTFHTALCVLNSTVGHRHLDLVPFEVTFRELQTVEIDDYLRREQPYDCAGAFKSEGLGIALVARMHGSDPTALIGLPLIRLCEILRQEGVDVLRRVPAETFVNQPK